MILLFDITFRIVIIMVVALGWCINAILKLQKKVKELEEKDIYEPTTVTQNTDIWRTKDDKIGIEIN